MVKSQALFTMMPVHNDDLPIQFVGKREHANGRTMNQYQLNCSSCGAFGEVGVALNKKELIECPEHCGALFIQTHGKGMFARPVLVEITASSLTKAKKESN
jgi:hypothetical protein